MFTIGQHVIVAASNAKKKSSPRVGSLGFLKQAYLKDSQTCERYIDLPMTVSFYRYGYEENFRCEQKTVRHAFPVMVAPSKTISMHSVVNAVKSSAKSNTVIIVPVKKAIDLFDCHDLVFEAWINSFFSGAVKSMMHDMYNGRFGPAGIRKTCNFKNSLPTSQFLREMYIVSGSKERKLLFIRKALENPSFRKKTIEELAAFRTLFVRREIQYNINNVGPMAAGADTRLRFMLMSFHPVIEYALKTMTPNYYKIIRSMKGDYIQLAEKANKNH
jgi:hypothetical protein